MGVGRRLGWYVHSDSGSLGKGEGRCPSFSQRRMGRLGGNLRDGSSHSRGFLGGSPRWLFILLEVGGRLFQFWG